MLKNKFKIGAGLVLLVLLVLIRAYAVSYTHLDVYKRQKQLCIAMGQDQGRADQGRAELADEDRGGQDAAGQSP